MHPLSRRIQELAHEDLVVFLDENLLALSEEEVLAILGNRFVTPKLLGKIAQSPRLIAFYSVRLKLVAHRQTPQPHAVKLVHYLHWFDLLRLSIDMQVSAPVRRSIDNQLVLRVEKLTLGEKITSARACSAALIKVFLYDPNPQVFASLLVNKRLREDDLLALISTGRASPEQLLLIAADRKWSYRYSVRKALVLNPSTPRSAAASQLRFLTRVDLRRIHANPGTSTYLRLCIERMQSDRDATQ